MVVFVFLKTVTRSRERAKLVNKLLVEKKGFVFRREIAEALGTRFSLVINRGVIRIIENSGLGLTKRHYGLGLIYCKRATKVSM